MNNDHGVSGQWEKTHAQKVKPLRASYLSGPTMYCWFLCDRFGVEQLGTNKRPSSSNNVLAGKEVHTCTDY